MQEISSREGDAVESMSNFFYNKPIAHGSRTLGHEICKQLLPGETLKE